MNFDGIPWLALLVGFAVLLAAYVAYLILVLATK